MDIGAGKTRPKADVPGLPARPAGEALGPFHQFFATASVPCPYVPGRAERKLIVELAGRGAPVFYDELSRAGFRRSHRFAYRPACRACTACVPVRIAVERFAHTRSTRRVRNANRELAGQLLAPRATVEQFESVRRLSAFAPPRQRHGGDELWRIPRHGRGHRGAHRGRRIPRPRRERWSRCR